MTRCEGVWEFAQLSTVRSMEAEIRVTLAAAVGAPAQSTGLAQALGSAAAFQSGCEPSAPPCLEIA